MATNSGARYRLASMADRAPTRYRNRSTGELEDERVFGGDALRFLYGTRRGRAITRLLLRRPLLNRVYGWFQRTEWSRGRVEPFVRALGIDASEAELPLGDYASLDAFFTRRLRAGARPVD